MPVRILLISILIGSWPIFSFASDEKRLCERKLSPLEAILEPAVFKAQVKAALEEVLAMPRIAWDRANQLEELFEGIARASYGQWEFRRIKGSDNSILFMGPDGPAVAVSPNGRLFKGLVPIDYFGATVWPADYSSLEEIPERPKRAN
jgi:hypothetical protein